ncbi:MAG TPA: hypothetical protein VIC62_14025 [Nakamurella sp.]
MTMLTAARPLVTTSRPWNRRARLYGELNVDELVITAPTRSVIAVRFASRVNGSIDPLGPCAMSGPSAGPSPTKMASRPTSSAIRASRW